MTTLRESLNQSTYDLADKFRIVKLGTILAGLVAAMRGAAPAASSYVNAAAEVPDAQVVPAARVTRAYVRAGGTPGALSVVTTVPPAAGQISIAPNGSLLVLAADAITDLDVQYEPHIGDIFETTQPVASNTLAIPQFLLDKKVVLAMEVEVLEGTSVGKKIIMAPGTAPAAGQAALNAALSTIAFNAADAVTSARVKLLVGSEADLQALLADDSPTLLQSHLPGGERPQP